MKIEMNTPLKNLDGSPAIVRDEAGDRVITVRKILVDTLMFPHEDDARMSGQDKVRLVKLALKVEGEDEPDFPVDDIAFLVGRVDKICPPLTVYRMREILDPASL